MASEEQVRESLHGILVPGAMRSLVRMNLVKAVAVSDNKVKVSLASTALGKEECEWIKEKVEESLKALPDVKEVETEFVEAKLSEVKEVKGSAGNFKVNVLKKARYVDTEKCIGCGECIAKCPVSVPSEFNLG